MSTRKLIWCVIYLASEKYTQLVTLISRDEKINASAVWGPPETWGPRAHWIRRHCLLFCTSMQLGASYFNSALINNLRIGRQAVNRVMEQQLLGSDLNLNEMAN